MVKKKALRRSEAVSTLSLCQLPLLHLMCSPRSPPSAPEIRWEKFTKLPKILKIVVVTFSFSKIRVRDQLAKLQSELKLGRRVVNESEETNNGGHKVLK